jgi:CysZ protein
VRVENNLGGGYYLNSGLSLIRQAGIKRYVVIPLFINIVLLGLATFYAFSQISEYYQSWATSDNAIVEWLFSNLEWLLWPIIVICVFIVVFFLFAFLANWIAAPFNGYLSEAVEKHLKQNHTSQLTVNAPNSVIEVKLHQELPRLFKREWRKFIYFIPRALLCLVLFFTPLAFLAPFIWFMFNAWMAAIQYIDYPMDNHKVPFKDMLYEIKQRKGLSLSFGGLVMLITMIPIINILIMPVAVAGATHLWFDHYQK